MFYILSDTIESMESHSNTLITWLIIFGVVLILSVGGAAYFLSAPSTPIIASNGSSAATTDHDSSGSPVKVKWQKGHYANLFYEFDYPDIFKITRESISADHTPDASGNDQFGTTQVILSGTKEASDGGYEIAVTTHQNSTQTAPEQFIADAKNGFFKDTTHGQNDAFQLINIGGKDAYKKYIQGAIIIGIPTGNLIHELRITWVPTTGSPETANEYLSALTDSYAVK